jgi:hypothetical protein
LRVKLDQAREVKDEKMDAISLDMELTKSAIKSNGRTRPAVKWSLHPAHLSLPGRMVMNVLLPTPQLPKPRNQPLTPSSPAVTIDVAADREELVSSDPKSNI